MSYILIFIAYFLQGVFYDSGGIFSQFLVSILLTMGFISFIKLLFLRNKPIFINLWCAFYFMLLITYILSPKEVYGVAYEAIGRVNTMSQFKESSIFCFSFFVSYRLTSKNIYTDNQLYRLGLVFFVLALIRFFFSQAVLHEIGNIGSMTNNASYLLVSIVPFTPFIFKKNRIMFITVLIGISSLVFIGAKRGAILCLFLSILYSFFYIIKKMKLSIKSIIGSLVVLLLIIGISYNQYMENEYVQYRFEKTLSEEGGIGAREIAYNVLFYNWLEENNFLRFFLGNGTAQTISVWGNYAHNDWLELLTNNGLFGVLIYLSLFISCFCVILKSKLDFYSLLSIHLCFIIWIVKSIFSMGYTDFSNSIFIIILGVMLGRINYCNSYGKK
ncbi:hypothetical protein [Bacteroides sp.]|uniref:O-antigen ligase family protein n=1 Tax=Bacteroides sp. TaxID=29523 RepID=UPI002590913C|nr:hypothetical protein [Bacteroides sp.]